MAQIAGACRFVYNLALERCRDWYGPRWKFNFISRGHEVAQRDAGLGEAAAR